MAGLGFGRVLHPGETFPEVLYEEQLTLPTPYQQADQAGGVGFVDAIAVDPAFRGHGLGDSITTRLIQELEALGATAILSQAWRRPDGVVPMAGIFSRHGMEVLGEVHGIWDEECRAGTMVCPYCGPDHGCTCSAVIYGRLLHASETRRRRVDDDAPTTARLS